jgi:hypothetical protein
MPARRPSIAARLVAELQSDAALREQLVQALGDGIATKADLAAQGRILERHTAVLEQLTEAVREQGKRIEEQGKRIEEQGKCIEEQGRRIEEQGKRIEEQGKRIEEQGLRIEEQGKRIEEQGLRIEEQGKRIEEQGKRIEEQGKRVEVQGQRVEEAFRRVEALGARWGIMSEDAFREGMRSVLERRFGAKVRHWEGFDPEGIVFGHPASIELDLVVDNGGTLVIEVKSHVSTADLAAFERKAKLYEQQTGTRANRLVVSPAVEPRAAKMAEDLGIEVSTSLG